MSGQSAQARFPKWTLAAAALCACAALLPGAFDALVLDRAAVLSGELWRLWTGHFAHGSGSHLAWSLLAFVLLGARVEPLLGNRYPMFLTACAGAVGVGVVAFLPGLQRYCGLSGVDTALYAYLLLADGARGRREGDPLLFGASAACAAALVGKIGFEFATGDALFAAIPGLEPVPAAHLIGALAGAAGRYIRTPRRPKSQTRPRYAPAVAAQAAPRPGQKDQPERSSAGSIRNKGKEGSTSQKMLWDRAATLPASPVSA